MIIDCHTHVGTDIFGKRNNIQNFNGTNQEQELEELLYKMDNLEVREAIVYPFPSPLAQFQEDDFWYHKENKNLIKITKEDPKIHFMPSFNPKDKKSVNYACELVDEYELKGLKLHTRTTQCNPSSLNSNIIEFLKKRDIPLMLHIGTGKEPELKEKKVDISLTSAIKLAEKYSNARFIFAHLGRLHKRLEEALTLENVIMDTSALSVKKVRDDYGAKDFHPTLIDLCPEEIIFYLVSKGYENKIMWGSDEPYGINYKEELNYVKKNEMLTNKQKHKILKKNASKWFDI